jgi:hypothetical protein
MMWTSWSHDQATHTQRHQIPRKPSKSGFIRVWHKDNLYLGTNTTWCEPRDHVVTQPTIKLEIWSWKAERGLIGVWHNGNLPQGTNTIGLSRMMPRSQFIQELKNARITHLNLDCGLRNHVITRFALVGITARLRNKVISFCYFCFFSVPLSFSVFASIFLFFVSASSKQKKRLYFILLLSLIISVC